MALSMAERRAQELERIALRYELSALALDAAGEDILSPAFRELAADRERQAAEIRRDRPESARKVRPDGRPMLELVKEA
jgi:hypothetical protein